MPLVPFPSLAAKLVNASGIMVPPWNSFFQNLFNVINSLVSGGSVDVGYLFDGAVSSNFAAVGTLRTWGLLPLNGNRTPIFNPDTGVWEYFRGPRAIPVTSLTDVGGGITRVGHTSNRVFAVGEYIQFGTVPDTNPLNNEILPVFAVIDDTHFDINFPLTGSPVGGVLINGVLMDVDDVEIDGVPNQATAFDFIYTVGIKYLDVDKKVAKIVLSTVSYIQLASDTDANPEEGMIVLSGVYLAGGDRVPYLGIFFRSSLYPSGGVMSNGSLSYFQTRYNTLQISFQGNAVGGAGFTALTGTGSFNSIESAFQNDMHPTSITFNVASDVVADITVAVTVDRLSLGGAVGTEDFKATMRHPGGNTTMPLTVPVSTYSIGPSRLRFSAKMMTSVGTATLDTSAGNLLRVLAPF